MSPVGRPVWLWMILVAGILAIALLVCAALALLWPAVASPHAAPQPLAVHAAAVDTVDLAAAQAAFALLKCPPGRYQQAVVGNESLARLRAHWQRLLDLGYRPRDPSPAAARRAAQRGFVTYESALWPRPAHCKRPARGRQRGPWPIVDEPPGTCEPAGTVCDKYRLSRAYKFVWHHVWKGGTTSLSPYLSCNMKALPVAGLLRRLPAPLPGYLHVGTSREPIRRFISAFQEVYARVRLRQQPHLQTASNSNATTHLGSGSAAPPRCWHRRVPWILVAMSSHAKQPTDGCTSPETPLSASDLRAIFRQFVSDVECSTHFPNVQHLYSQSLFLGGNTSVPQPLDLLLRLESLAADLNDLKRAVGYSQPDACPLKTERAAKEKPEGVPHADTLRDLLRDEPQLRQAICNVYVQDFVCLGYEMPEGCELLPRHASTPPNTMGITPAVLTPRRRRGRRGGGPPQQSEHTISQPPGDQVQS